ncbi:MAG: 2-C-methyl-D-erythritol 4-phosphate cytidylyltransferase [Dehalococcoidia bacterium]|nr:2-C-methyl-D-erythritol 4-phosphate cytidylyltransferase [Dehalococcoidia bacterium]
MSEPVEGRVCGVILAAGKSERMRGIDKMFAPLLGRPLVVWTLAAFQQCDAVDEVVIVAPSRSRARLEALAREWRASKVRDVVAGGARRQDSVRAGIAAAPDAALVAVHDGARMMVTPELIGRGVDLARRRRAAVCAIPARDTLKHVEGEPPVVRATLDRTQTWLAQTPQVFERALLLEAHERAGAAATDDAALVEALGEPVYLYEGAAWNLKVTTPDDLIIAEALLRARLDAAL